MTSPQTVFFPFPIFDTNYWACTPVCEGPTVVARWRKTKNLAHGQLMWPWEWQCSPCIAYGVFTIICTGNLLARKYSNKKTRKKQKKYKLWSTTLGMAIKTKHRIFRALFIKKIVEIETTNLKINLSFKFKSDSTRKKLTFFHQSSYN